MAKKKSTRRPAATRKKAARPAPKKSAGKKTARKAAARPRATPAPEPAATVVAPARSDQRERARRVAIAAARALEETNCADVVVLDLAGLSQVWDFLVLGSGTSERQMRTAIDRAEHAAAELGERPFGGHRDRSPTWMALDFVDVAVHVFEPSTRATYDLELLWGDAPRVEWEAAAPRARAGRRAAGAG